MSALKLEAKTAEELFPNEICAELDRYIVGQKDAKRAVAIALRNRIRRLKVEGEMKEEITPKNIILIGPTGVGKTEIARRLAKLAGAPFSKVEASKFTEVGYVGKDVESMVRDLVEIAINMVRENESERVQDKAKMNAEEKLLDLLLPKKKKAAPGATPGFDLSVLNLEGEAKNNESEPQEDSEKTLETEAKTREKLRQMLKDGKLDERLVELKLETPKPGGFGGAPGMPMIEIVSGSSMDDINNNLRDMFGNMFSGDSKKKKMKVPEAYKALVEQEAAKLVDMENVKSKAIDLVENNGIIFLDEIDKIASSADSGRSGADVSREGVQRDILPIVEGSTVSTKYGFVKTNHILFIASGAFHVSKPSDLIPELQGRFPIRVELHALKKPEFLRILKEPKNSLIKQYQALMKTEGVDLVFTEDALEEMAGLAEFANEQMENIGARRLHTIMERVMDELSFEAKKFLGQTFKVDAAYVKTCLKEVIQDQDLSQYIL